MSGLATLPTPAKPSELLRAVADLLRADSTLLGALRKNADGSSGTWAATDLITIQSAGAPRTGSTDRPPRRLVVRLPLTASGLRERTGRALVVPVQLMLETDDGAVLNLTTYHDYIHTLAHGLLAGQRPSLASATLHTGIERIAAPSGVAFDANDHAHYTTARYQACMKP